MEDKSWDSFVFTHIPKCGGSSFRRFVFNACIASGVEKSKMYVPGEGGLAHDKNWLQLNEKQKTELLKKGISVLADHTKLDLKLYGDLSMEQPFIYTIFRKPIDRFISHYNFFYKQIGMGSCKGVELASLPTAKLTSIIKQVANIQTAYLLNENPGFENRQGIFLRFEEAKEMLTSEISCFGILEDLPNSMRLLESAKPSWLIIEKNVPAINKTKAKRSVKHARVEKLFPQYNKMDIALYKMALRIFNKKLEEI